MQALPDIMHYLTVVAPVIPFPIYWTDTEPRVLGTNQSCLDELGGIDKLTGPIVIGIFDGVETRRSKEIAALRPQLGLE